MLVQDLDLVCTSRKGGQGHQGSVWLEIKRNCDFIFFWNCGYFSNGTCDLLPSLFISFEVLFCWQVKGFGGGRVKVYWSHIFMLSWGCVFVIIGEFLDQAWELSAKMKNFMAVKLDFPQGKQLFLELGVQKRRRRYRLHTEYLWSFWSNYHMAIACLTLSHFF